MNSQAISIIKDDLSDGNIARLLQEHMTDMLLHSPPESVHALDPALLDQPDITFWSAWLAPVEDESSKITRDTPQSKSAVSVGLNEFAGCCALKDLGHDQAELKSMKTELLHLRKGVADALLSYVIAQAKRRNITQLYLETGTPAVFEPAIKLYLKHGFEICGPFGDYVEDPLSMFMRLDLSC